MIVGGVEYLDEDLELFPDGLVQDGMLAGDSDIQGLPCAGGRFVQFYRSGRLKFARLSRTTCIGGVPCGTGHLHLHENGSVMNASVAVDHSFDGITVRAGQRVTLDEDGRLVEYSRKLEADETIGGLPCADGFDNVWLYPSGRPSVVVLAAATVIDGREYPRGTELHLDSEGAVIDSWPVDIDSGQRYQHRVFGVFEPSIE